MPPLPLDSPGLDGARAALAAPQRRRVGVMVALGCAGLMAAAATALCAVVLLGGWAPAAGAQVTGVHARFTR